MKPRPVALPPLRVEREPLVFSVSLVGMFAAICIIEALRLAGSLP